MSDNHPTKRTGKDKNKKGASTSVSPPPVEASTGETEVRKQKRIKNKVYEQELARLQIELVKLQEWIKEKGLRIVVLFEGRDAAGKGGAIKRITEKLSPESVG